METSGVNRKKLAILDDYFPNLKTGFRISEFNYYLERLPDCVVYSTRYDLFHQEYAAAFPQFQDKVKHMTDFDWTGEAYSLFYTVFLGNAHSFYFIYEMTNTPFVLELYPGGGYWMNDPEVDAKLIKILQSPLLLKVIVTQKKTYEYIVNRGFVSPDKVVYIYGMVTHPQYFHTVIPKRLYKRDKSTFDICFVAHKYMTQGLDKGYHIFVDMCRKLAAAAPDIRFHVVGNFDPSDLYVGDLDGRITFYGLQDHAFFLPFYSGMDIIVSPNIPFLLIPGKSYDGFPTGCCIDAALNNVAVFCTDELQENERFENGGNIVILPPVADSFADSILGYYRQPEKLYGLSEAGQAKFREVFDFESQMGQRTAVLRQYM